MKEEWATALNCIPPGLTLAQAARVLGRGYHSTRRHLMGMGYEWKDGRRNRYDLHPPLSRVPWGKVDWRQSNIAISRKFRVCRELVRRMRLRLGKPFIESRGRKPKKGSNHASKISQATKIHGHVRSQRQPAQKLPPKKGGPRVFA